VILLGDLYRVIVVVYLLQLYQGRSRLLGHINRGFPLRHLLGHLLRRFLRHPLGYLLRHFLEYPLKYYLVYLLGHFIKAQNYYLYSKT
jgi:hypothetical protein